MACAQACTIRVRAAALPSRSINHEPPPLQRLLLDSTFPLPYQHRPSVGLCPLALVELPLLRLQDSYACDLFLLVRGNSIFDGTFRSCLL
jgi:hypothetical protein